MLGDFQVYLDPDLHVRANTCSSMGYGDQYQMRVGVIGDMKHMPNVGMLQWIFSGSHLGVSGTWWNCRWKISHIGPSVSNVQLVHPDLRSP